MARAVLYESIFQDRLFLFRRFFFDHAFGFVQLVVDVLVLAGTEQSIVAGPNQVQLLNGFQEEGV